MSDPKINQKILTSISPKITKGDYAQIKDPKKLEKIKAELEQKLAKEQERIEKFIRIAELREKQTQRRKNRAKNIYFIGDIIAQVFGDKFYEVVENPKIKDVITGLILRVLQELENNNWDNSLDGKKSWLEHHRNLGKEFWMLKQSNKS